MNKDSTLSIDEYLNYQSEAEAKYGENTVVFYENGTFYELYGVDNEKEKMGQPKRVSEILNIALTRKSKKVLENSRKNPLMVGVPTAHSEKHIKTLIANGFTIVFVEQTTKPPNPQRGITHVLSPTTYIADEYRSDNNYVLAIYFEMQNMKLGVGMCAYDLTTGDGIFYQTNIAEKEVVLEEVFRFMESIDPKEIIINVENCDNLQFDEIRDQLELYRHQYYVRELKKDYYKIGYQNQIIAKVFPNDSMLSPVEQINMEFQQMSALALMLCLDFIFDHDDRILRSLNPPREWEEKQHLILNNNTSYQLNIVCDGSLGNAKSLLDIINGTKTIMGKRALKNWMLNPVISPQILERKYNTLDKIIHKHLWKDYDKLLSMVIDLERFFRKMSIGYLLPHELAAFEPSLDAIKGILLRSEKDFTHEDNNFMDILSVGEVEKESFLNFFQKYYNTFDLNLMATFGLNDINQSFFKLGIIPELDEIQEKIKNERDYFEKEAVRLGKLIDIPDAVKFDHNDRDGYFLRTTAKRGDLLEKKLGPGSVKNTAANVSRIVSKELEQANIRLNKAEANIRDRVRDCFLKWCEDEYKENHQMFSVIVKFIASLDMMVNSGKICKENCYSRPIIERRDHESFFRAKGLRHPIIEKINKDTLYVPNDIEIDGNGILLYGLNGGGKSSLLKAVGLATVMAQMGLFVPAEQLIFYPFKTLYTRIMGSDNIFRGLSSFALEMTELRTILQYADKRSLILGDEICRGTEIHSALSIVSSAVHLLCKKQTNFLFATHLHKLHEIDVVKKCSNLKHFYIDLTMNDGKLVFGRKIYEGIGRSLYGLEVAEHIVENREFLELAKNVRKQLLGLEEEIISTKKSIYNTDVYVNECEICKKNNIQQEYCKNIDISSEVCTSTSSSAGRRLEVHRNDPLISGSSKDGIIASAYKPRLEVHRNEISKEISSEVWTSKSSSAGRRLEVHHINSQKFADCDDNIDHFNKNHKGNLVVLCEEHHSLVHQGELEIRGWINTSRGLELEWSKKIEEKVEQKVHIIDKGKRELDDDVKIKIKGYSHLTKNLPLRIIKAKIEKDLNLKLSLDKIKIAFNS